MKPLLTIIAVLLALNLANNYFNHPPRAEADTGLSYSTMFQCGQKDNQKDLLNALGEVKKFSEGKRVVGFSAYSDLQSLVEKNYYYTAGSQHCFAVMIQK